MEASQGATRGGFGLEPNEVSFGIHSESKLAMHQDKECISIFPFSWFSLFFLPPFFSSLLGRSRGACVPSSSLPWTLSRL